MSIASRHHMIYNSLVQATRSTNATEEWTGFTSSSLRSRYASRDGRQGESRDRR
jgi:hypothetical protein